jgi:hypothetical protein
LIVGKARDVAAQVPAPIDRPHVAWGILARAERNGSA